MQWRSASPSWIRMHEEGEPGSKTVHYRDVCLSWRPDSIDASQNINFTSSAHMYICTYRHRLRFIVKQTACSQLANIICAS